MNNQLFIVCPFSCMETFLQHRYGNNIFFLTFSGSIFQFHDFEYILQVRDFIVREKIQTIYIVSDTSCRFINGVIMRNKRTELQTENIIEELYIDNYFTDFKGQTFSKQKYILAELNIRNQINEILNSAILGTCISESDIQVKGIITSKELNIYKEIQIEDNSILHEL